MAGENQPTEVCIVTAPDAACAGLTWSEAVSMIRNRLAHRFGGVVTVEHVAVFSPRFFELPGVVSDVAGGSELPIVLVGGAVVSRGGKLSQPQIAAALRGAGVSETGGDRP